jgi:hypothetical protein
MNAVRTLDIARKNPSTPRRSPKERALFAQMDESDVAFKLQKARDRLAEESEQVGYVTAHETSGTGWPFGQSPEIVAAYFDSAKKDTNARFCRAARRVEKLEAEVVVVRKEAERVSRIAGVRFRPSCTDGLHQIRAAIRAARV